MTESGQLLRVIRVIRRRARALAAVEGAFVGAAVGLGALAVGALVWRAWGGHVSWRAVVSSCGAAAAVGGLLGGTRPLPLSLCARWLDAALDRGVTARDRVLSALSFVTSAGAPLDERGDALLARAALHDALTRARSVAPSLVAPSRRPRALPALGVAALALAAVGAWPARAPGARRDAGPAATKAEAPVRVASEALDAERAEIAAASSAAEASGDVDLTALACEARTALDALADGQLGRGEALERLTTLAARAKETADEAASTQSALRAAGKALEATATTRALGRALDAADGEATKRALDALAARAADGAGPRAGLASALGAAAAAVGSAAAGDDHAADGRRRLNREHDAAGSNGAQGARGDESARRLERLQRDLEDTASACRGNAEECANRLRGGGGLPSAAREAQQSAARRRLENAVSQARERLRRGDLEGGARERRFARAARGDAPEGRRGSPPDQQQGQPGTEAGERNEPGGGASPGGEGQGEGSGALPDNAQSAGEGDVFSEDGQEGASAASGASAAGEARAGQGAGSEAGGEALGRAALPPTRGQERRVSVRSNAGPTRSEVISASARRGFAARDYVRVFDDYQPVVEESLASGAVPEGRRYVVRRYFQLIRPRAGAAPRSP